VRDFPELCYQSCILLILFVYLLPDLDSDFFSLLLLLPELSLLLLLLLPELVCDPEEDLDCLGALADSPFWLDLPGLAVADLC